MYKEHHHWYGHVADVAPDNKTFTRGFLGFMFLVFGIPLLIAFPEIIVLLVALYVLTR